MLLLSAEADIILIHKNACELKRNPEMESTVITVWNTPEFPILRFHL